MGSDMSFDDIDLDRVVVDPDYRRQVIEFLNASARQVGAEGPAEPLIAPVKVPTDTTV